MGNTQSNESAESNENDFGRSSETPRDKPIMPVAAGRPIKKFHDFDSNSPFVGSPLLSHEEYKKEGIDIYEYIQNDDLASSYDILVGDSGSSKARTSSLIAVEPPYWNLNKISHDLKSSDGLTPLTSVNEQGVTKGIPTIITWSHGGNNVYVTGTFNDWKQNIRLCKSSKDFTTVINLTPGTHKLKFIVDDEWKCSSDLSTATDPDGNLVNYLEVYEDDYETINQEGFDSDDLSSTPPAEYTDKIPSYLLAYDQSVGTEENVEGNSNTEDAGEPSERLTKNRPPTLPPHLERVLLNFPAISKDDNSVLPEPNHVVLNHLYACSIRDNVMAVAGTARYRKKYVTTVYYKPIFT
ncbi:11731_t:CDS:2 [Acaulospora morrowiae]|uniref:11731_t:CDS:1 n=1 Tax=Acaulospora morrowiae TaxID=94023 RepID=A0A9N8YN02_9GLOM|nr:11731_t:CDS:2 [Acaulospora morrowiae]